MRQSLFGVTGARSQQVRESGYARLSTESRKPRYRSAPTRSPYALTRDSTREIAFREAIDQAVAESVASFNAQIENARNLLLGCSGGVQGPLQVIQFNGQIPVKSDASTDVATAAARSLGGANTIARIGALRRSTSSQS